MKKVSVVELPEVNVMIKVWAYVYQEHMKCICVYTYTYMSTDHHSTKAYVCVYVLCSNTSITIVYFSCKCIKVLYIVHASWPVDSNFCRSFKFWLILEKETYHSVPQILPIFSYSSFTGTMYFCFPSFSGKILLLE